MGPMIVNPHPGANLVSLIVVMTMFDKLLKKQKGLFLKFF